MFKNIQGEITSEIGDMRNWLNKKYFSRDKEIRKLLLRIICDFLAGMTDQFALFEHQRLYSSSDNINLRNY